MVKTFTPKFNILLLVILQFFTVLGITVFNWPQEMVWINFALAVVFVLLSTTFHSLLLLVYLMPFYIVLPNPNFDELSFWRPLVALIFAKWLVWEVIKEKKYPKFFIWDKALVVFFGIALFCTVFFAKFKLPAMMHLIFLLNAYLVYVLAANCIRSKTDVFEAVKAGVWSLGVVIAFGFAQLLFTFLVDMDTFWVYWASNISKVFYGDYFMEVALFSNSWFSFTAGRELRMFSIMPDSQSFAYLTVFALGLGTALTCVVSESSKKWLWSGIRFAGLGLILSGTRAVWVGMLVPLSALVFARWKNFHKAAVKKYLWPFAIILLLFVISPFINKGLQVLRFGGMFQENFLQRAESIYDLREASNAGRLQIWKDSSVFTLRHPWGVGPKNFLVSLSAGEENFEKAAEQLDERYNLPQIYISAHNLYLQFLVETGLLGLLAFLYFCFIVLKEVFGFLKTHNSKFDFPIAVVFQFAVIFLWILSSAFFDVTLLNDKVLILFFLNLALAGVVIRDYSKLNESS